jgi:RHS repeat-associated protein
VPTGDGYYRLLARHSAKSLDVEGASTANGAAIHQWDYAGGANQQWQVESVGGGYYRIVARHSGKCLDVPEAAQHSGAWLHQWDCWGGHNQQFQLRAVGAAGGAAQIDWLVTDHLGTPRMIADQTGSLVGIKRHDYLPFGEEIGAGVGGRTTGQGYSQLDGVRFRYTGAERDDETGLDFMQARYFSSTQGRFTSPDPLLSSGELHDPQTWNRYAYALNNPLLYTDPTGLFVYAKGVEDEQKKQFEAALNKAKNYLNKVAETYGKNSNQYKKAERALNSYGKPGEANGVTVIANDKVDAGKTTLNNKAITVAFNPNQFENIFFQALVGHEGSHVADAKDYLSTGKSPTEYQFEYDGHFVDSVLGEMQAKEMNYANFYVSVGGSKNAPEQKVDLWNKSWEEADKATLKATLRDKAVSQALAVSQKDTGYPSNTQKAFRTIQPTRRRR